MIKELSLLVEIQTLDSQIIKAKKIIEESPDAISGHEKTYQNVKKEYELRKAELESAKKKKKDLYTALEDLSLRIEKLKERSSSIKTNKEFHSHLAEIAQVEAEKLNVEDNILDAMENIDAKSAALKKIEADFKVEEEKVKVKKGHIDKDKEKAVEVLDELLKRRRAFSNHIGKELHEEYLNMLERMDGVAVANVENSICYGCFMNIPPQLYVETMRNDKLYKCPQCGRFIYYKEQPKEE